MKKLIIIAIGLLPFALQSAEVTRDANEQVNQLLLYFTAMGNIEGVKNALETGANVNCRGQCRFYGHTQLGGDSDYYSPSILANSFDHLDTFKLKGFYDVGSPFRLAGPIYPHYNYHISKSDFYNPLHLAAYLGHLEITKTLILAGAEINAIDYNRCTPLHLAALKGHTEIVNEFINTGADINIEAAPSNLAIIPSTPLSLAFYEGHVDVVDLLLPYGARARREKFRYNVPDEIRRKIYKLKEDNYRIASGVYDLFDAIKYNNVYQAKNCIESGVNVNAFNQLDYYHNNQTSLHYAALIGRTEIAKLLIKAKANVNAIDRLNRTPLLNAINNGRTSIVKELLRAGADPESVKLIVNQNSNKNKIYIMVENHKLELLKTVSEFFIELNKHLHFSTGVLDIITQYFCGIKADDIPVSHGCCVIL